MVFRREAGLGGECSLQGQDDPVFRLLWPAGRSDAGAAGRRAWLLVHGGGADPPVLPDWVALWNPGAAMPPILDGYLRSGAVLGGKSAVCEVAPGSRTAAPPAGEGWRRPVCRRRSSGRSTRSAP